MSWELPRWPKESNKWKITKCAGKSASRWRKASITATRRSRRRWFPAIPTTPSRPTPQPRRALSKALVEQLNHKEHQGHEEKINRRKQRQQRTEFKLYSLFSLRTPVNELIEFIRRILCALRGSFALLE